MARDYSAIHYEDMWQDSTSQPKNIIEGLHKLYRRDWWEYLPMMPGETLDEDTHQVKQPLAPGLVYYLVKILSTLYARPVSRTSENSELLSEMYWKGLDATMAQADRWSRLYGTALIGLYFTPGEKTPFHHFVVGPKDFAIHFETKFDLEPSLVMVKINSSKYHVWSRDEFIVLDDHFRVVKKNPNPIGKIPFITVVTDRDPDKPNIGMPFGGFDVLHNINAVARLLREVGWTATLQRGQPWTTSPDAEVVLSPDFLVRVGQGNTFGIAANSADIASMLDAFTELLSQFLIGCGLTPDIAVGHTSATSSGVAIALQRTDIQDDRQAREAMFKGIESDLLDILSLWISAETNLNLSFEQTVTYSNVPIMRTASEDLAMVQFLYDKKMLSRAESLKLLRPELSMDTIKQLLIDADEDAVSTSVNNTPALLLEAQAPTDEDTNA